jgi:hypothetical protein
MLNAAGARREDQRQRQRRWPARGPRLVRHRHAQNASHAIEQRSPSRSHRKRGRRGAPGFELGERACVRDRIAGDAHRHLVTAMLALGPDARRQPPHGGVIEEHGLCDRLQQIHCVVVAANVRKLVRKDRFHLRGRKRRHGRHRQNDCGPQPADHRGHVHERRLDHVGRRRKTESIGDATAGCLPLR